MGEFLLARLKDEQSTELNVEWINYDSKSCTGGQIRFSSVDEFIKQANSRPVVFIYSGERVLLRSVNIPGSHKVNLSQVLPFALEDEIAEELSEPHISHVKQPGTDSIAVAITNKAMLEQFVEQITANNIPLNYLLPESLLLPWKEGAISIFCHADSVSLRYGMFEGCTVKFELTETIVRKILAESHYSHISKAYVWGDQNGAITRLLSGLEIGLIEDRKSERLSQSIQLFEIAKLDKAVTGLNLLQGIKRSVQNRTSWSSPETYVAAVIMILAFILMVGGQAYQYTQLKSHNESLQAQIQQKFKQTFPEVKRLVDPLVQARQKLQQVRSKPSSEKDPFMDMLYLLGEQINNDQALMLKNMQFASGQMDIIVNTDDIVKIEQLAYRLSDSNRFQAEVVSTKTNNGDIQARMKIRGMQ